MQRTAAFTAGTAGTAPGPRRRTAWAWVPSLYFAEGLPYAVVTVVATLMYKRLGADNAAVAFVTSWLYLPWVVKPLWSPLVDAAGTKRGWVLAMQLLLAAAFGAVALSLTSAAWAMAAFWALLLAAFASATHDIAADGYYMLALDSHGQSRMVGFRTTFYRLAMLAAQGVLVMLAGRLETAPELGVAGAWQGVMLLLTALFALLALWHRLVLPAPLVPEPGWRSLRGLSLRTVVTDPFRNAFATFFRSPGIWGALAFIMLFRLPEAQLLKMISPFMVDPASAGGLGLTTAQVGLAYGTVGVASLLAGGILGGLAGARYGLARCMVPMAWVMSASCAAFLVLSLWPQPPFWAVMAGVALEQLGYGFGNTAYMLYLLWFSSGPMATSRYAFCTGFMALGMMLPGMAAGSLQQWMGYPGFFTWTLACCAVTLLLAIRAKIPSGFGKKG